MCEKKRVFFKCVKIRANSNVSFDASRHGVDAVLEWAGMFIYFLCSSDREWIRPLESQTLTEDAQKEEK